MTIRIEYRYNARDLAYMNRHQQVGGPVRHWPGPVVSAILCVTPSVLILVGLQWWIPLGLFAALTALFFGILIRSQRRHTRRDTSVVRVLELNDGYVANRVGDTLVQTRWDAITEFEEDDRYFMLTTRGPAFILPKRSFTTPDQEKSFRESVRKLRDSQASISSVPIATALDTPAALRVTFRWTDQEIQNIARQSFQALSSGQDAPPVKQRSPGCGNLVFATLLLLGTIYLAGTISIEAREQATANFGTQVFVTLMLALLPLLLAWLLLKLQRKQQANVRDLLPRSEKVLAVIPEGIVVGDGREATRHGWGDIKHFVRASSTIGFQTVTDTIIFIPTTGFDSAEHVQQFLHAADVLRQQQQTKLEATKTPPARDSGNPYQSPHEP